MWKGETVSVPTVTPDLFRDPERTLRRLACFPGPRNESGVTVGECQAADDSTEPA